MPTWPILRPSWDHLRQKSPPNRARNLKRRPQSPQDHPGGRQRAPAAPGAWIFMVSGSILDLILKVVLQSLLQFFMACLPQVKEWGGFARAAHWIFWYHILKSYFITFFLSHFYTWLLYTFCTFSIYSLYKHCLFLWCFHDVLGGPKIWFSNIFLGWPATKYHF